MRIAELSRRSGVPVPTIKYYLREGLLPAGELSSPNQASYAEAHLHRLRLIRALIELASVPVARVKSVLEAFDSKTMSTHDRIGTVHRAVTPSRQVTADDDTRAAATAQVREFVKGRGWIIDPDAPAIATLVDTITALRALDRAHLAEQLGTYAEAVERIAEMEVAATAARGEPDQIAESVVIGTILGETLISALRLLAHENLSARLMRSTTPLDPGSTDSP
ncbi:MerR family transcriptional regulator [Plantactinospora sp. GCM10030261]|uniref:MerR family transcriptional regulator n=1 Tax=Plantactinospora sp. GCM10030261 TaxID=3273420 RepID=UPI003616360E